MWSRLFPTFVVLFEIAKLANASRVIRSLWMWAIVRCFFPPELMVALGAHSFCIKNFISVGTISNSAATSFFSLLDLLRNLIVGLCLLTSRAL